MFSSFARSLVKTLEHSAESIISGGPHDESILENDAHFSNTKGNKAGFRVLSVKPDSSAHKAGLESWFDYIIGINGHELPTNYNQQYQLFPNYEYFIKEIENCKNRLITFEVWNAKGGCIKYIEIPINELSAAQNLDDIPLEQNETKLIQQSFGKLGLQIQWTPLIAATYVYHVLQIHPNSPAERAGLIEHSDYIIGAQDGLLATGGEDLLGRLIASKKDQSLVLYVYNHDYDVVRPVTIQPVENWGGNGLLGAGVGYGFLHRLPSVAQNLAPGSVLFDEKVNLSQESFQPVNQPLPIQTIPQPVGSPVPPSTGPPPIHARKKKSAPPVKSDLLDYLQQEGEKSRKLDNQGRASTDASENKLPPPPK